MKDKAKKPLAPLALAIVARAMKPKGKETPDNSKRNDERDESIGKEMMSALESKDHKALARTIRNAVRVYRAEQ